MFWCNYNGHEIISVVMVVISFYTIFLQGKFNGYLGIGGVIVGKIQWQGTTHQQTQCWCHGNNGGIIGDNFL